MIDDYRKQPVNLILTIENIFSERKYSHKVPVYSIPSKDLNSQGLGGSERMFINGFLFQLFWIS